MDLNHQLSTGALLAYKEETDATSGAKKNIKQWYQNSRKTQEVMREHLPWSISNSSVSVEKE